MTKDDDFDFVLRDQHPEVMDLSDAQLAETAEETVSEINELEAWHEAVIAEQRIRAARKEGE
jgi:hypothetical protein